MLLVLPLTKEFHLTYKQDGFEVQWSYYDHTKLYIKISDTTLFNEIQNHISTISIYQREPFKQGSASHQWIWFYEEGIPPELKVVHEEVEKDFKKRATVQLLPKHFSRGPMENYVKQQLKKREAEFLIKKNIKIVVCTWNAAGTGPKESIIPLLTCKDNEILNSSYPDIIIFGLQEMCPLNAKNLLGDESRKNDWLEFIIIQTSFAYPAIGYVPVIFQSLVGLLCVVLCSSEIVPNVMNAKESLVKLGLNGYAGNKGAICLRFEIFNSSFCIVNCHLAAHKGKVSLRNKNIKTILNHANFLIDGNNVKISEHDYVFWIGDLNYRITNLTYDEIISKIIEKDFLGLLEFDQLLIEKDENGVLIDYKEGKLTFPPTFKVIKGTNYYKY